MTRPPRELVCMLSCFRHVWLFTTLWTITCQALLSLGFSRQEHWTGLPFPSPMHESEKWKWSRSVDFSCVQFFVTLWTVAPQAFQSIGFSRQEYWSRLSCPLLGDLPNSGIKLMILKSPALAGRLFTTSTTWEAPKYTGLVLLYSMV